MPSHDFHMRKGGGAGRAGSGNSETVNGTITPETRSEKTKLHSHYIWVNRWHLGKWLCSSQIEMTNSTYNI